MISINFINDKKNFTFQANEFLDELTSPKVQMQLLHV